MEIDQEFKELFLEAARAALLAKADKLKEVADGSAGDWRFDETGSLGVENQIKGAIRELRRQVLDIDFKLMELAESQHEREQKGKEESKGDDSPLNENEQAEQALMGHEEELTKEFERDCAKEWNRRRLARERVCDCRWRGVWARWDLSNGSIRVHGDVRGRVRRGPPQ